MKLKSAIATVLALVLWSSTSAHADTPITIDGGWVPFSFGGVGSFSNEGPFTFTAATTVDLKITDAFLSGDRFNVQNFLSSLGDTSIPGSVGDQIGSDYDSAFADSRWSSGLFVLGPGSYSINMQVLASPFGGGGAALRVDTAQAIPAPAASMFGLAGFGLLALRRARRA